jgi:hypothetical protein
MLRRSSRGSADTSRKESKREQNCRKKKKVSTSITEMVTCPQFGENNV